MLLNPTKRGMPRREDTATSRLLYPAQDRSCPSPWKDDSVCGKLLAASGLSREGWCPIQFRAGTN